MDHAFVVQQLTDAAPSNSAEAQSYRTRQCDWAVAVEMHLQTSYYATLLYRRFPKRGLQRGDALFKRDKVPNPTSQTSGL